MAAPASAWFNQTWRATWSPSCSPGGNGSDITTADRREDHRVHRNSALGKSGTLGPVFYQGYDIRTTRQHRGIGDSAGRQVFAPLSS